MTLYIRWRGIATEINREIKGIREFRRIRISENVKIIRNRNPARVARPFIGERRDKIARPGRLIFDVVCQNSMSAEGGNEGGTRGRRVDTERWGVIER